MAENKEIDCPNNVRLFQFAISNNLKNISESVSEDQFVEVLTILKSNPNGARKLHKAMIKELYSSMNDDFEDMLHEGSLQEALTRITKLSEDCATTSNGDAWRPPGDVMPHLRALDAHKIKTAIDELGKEVSEIERENETLMEIIAKSRSRICTASDNVTRGLDRAPTILQQLDKTRTQLTNCLKIINS